jgi:hypothetical protein
VPINIGPVKLAVAYGPPFTEIFMFVPSQPAATKYQLVVLLMVAVEITVLAVDPSVVTVNFTLCVTISKYTSHSPYGRPNLPTNDASLSWFNVPALAQNVAKK